MNHLVLVSLFALSTAAMANPYSIKVLQDIEVSGSVDQIYINNGMVYEYTQDVPAGGITCTVDVEPNGHHSRTIARDSIINGLVTVVEADGSIAWPSVQHKWVSGIACDSVEGTRAVDNLDSALKGVLELQ